MKIRSSGELSGNECPVCFTLSEKVFHTNRKKYNYYRCAKCECVFIENKTPQDPYPVNALTPERQRSGFFRDFRSNRNWVWGNSDVKWISSYAKHFNLGDQPKALSIGCAYGHDLYNLKKMGWNVLGLDHDESFRVRAKIQHGVEVIHSTFEDAKFDSPFNLVMMAGVVPYVYGINEVIGKVNAILTDNGFIYIAIRNMDWVDGREVLEYPANVHARQYFSEKSMRLLLDAHGFEVVAIDSFYMRMPLLEKLPDRIKNFKLTIGNGKFSPLKELLNLNHIVWRLLGVEPFISCTRKQADSLRILAKKK